MASSSTADSPSLPVRARSAGGNAEKGNQGAARTTESASPTKDERGDVLFPLRAGGISSGLDGAPFAPRDSHRRTVSSVSLASSIASSDDVPSALFDSLVAAFPIPPTQQSLPSDRPSAPWARRPSLRQIPPVAGPPPTAPLPPTPGSHLREDTAELAKRARAERAKRPPSISLPPVPPASTSASLPRFDLRALSVRHTEQLASPISPSFTDPTPLALSPYYASAVPSPSSAAFSGYVLPDSSAISPPSPLATVVPASRPSPTEASPPASPVPEVLARFAFPATPPREGGRSPTLRSASSDDSPIQLHISLPTASSPSRSSTTKRPRMRPVRQSSTDSLASYASSTTSRASTGSSLEMDKVTSELSLLVASFRSPTPSSTLNVRSLSPTSTVLELGADEVEEDEERERAERERLLRRVKSTIEIQARKMSRASSSTGSVSVVSEGGSTMTRGGYRAYKLARRSSFLHSPENHRRRRASSTSSRLSTGSSDNSSESEELFDLSFDTPSTSPALERDGFAWSSSQSRYGRRKSSTTTVDEPVSPTGASTVAMGRSQSDMGPSAGSMQRKYGAREAGQGSLALPTVMRRAESSDGVVRTRPPALALPPIPDYSAPSTPAPQSPRSAARPLRPLAPSLRRRTSIAGSLSIPTTSTILPRNWSHGSTAGGSSPTRLATVQEPETEAEQSPFAAAAGLKPLALGVGGAPKSRLYSSTQHGPHSKPPAVTPPKHRPLLTSASASALSSAYHAAPPSALPRATGRSPLAPRSTSPFFGTKTISSRKSSLPLPASSGTATAHTTSLPPPPSRLPLSPNPPLQLPHGTTEVHKRKSSIATLPYRSSDIDGRSAECASIGGHQESLRAASAASGVRCGSGVRMPCR